MEQLVNIRQAKVYAEEMDGMIYDFQELLDEDMMDVQEVTINKLKQNMHNQFNCMKAANVKTIIGLLRTLSVSVWSKPYTVMATDTEEETPSGAEMIQKLSPRKWNTSMVKDNTISLFDHIANEQS